MRWERYWGSALPLYMSVAGIFVRVHRFHKSSRHDTVRATIIPNHGHGRLITDQRAWNGLNFESMQLLKIALWQALESIILRLGAIVWYQAVRAKTLPTLHVFTTHTIN
jgi:hypothetical protein